MSCSRTQRSDASEARTSGPSVSSQALYSTTEPLRSHTHCLWEFDVWFMFFNPELCVISNFEIISLRLERACCLILLSSCCRVAVSVLYLFMGGFRGGQGVRTPPSLKSHKNIGFPRNTGPDPLKITKLPSQHSMLGHHWHASETPFKWRFTCGPMMSCLYYSGIWISPSLIN